MATGFQKRVLQDYTFDVTEVEDFINDRRLMALAHIRFMTTEGKDEVEKERTDEIKEMVAFLLNQTKDDEKVQLIS